MPIKNLERYAARTREYWVNVTVLEFMQTLSTCSEFKDLVQSNADMEALQRIVDKAIRVGVELRSREE